MENIKAFVINLPSAVDRRINIEGQLKSIGIDYEIVDAVDGKILREGDARINWGFATENAHWVSRGALACSLSHLSVYRKIIDRDLDIALVLEDDTVIDSDIQKIVSNIQPNYIRENEVVLLYYASWDKLILSSKSKEHLASKYCLADALVPGKFISANAYFITRSACISMIEKQLPVTATADSWGKFIENNAVSYVRCIYPMVARPADFKSSIDYIDSNNVKGKIFEFIDKYKIYPFYSLLKLRRTKMRERMLNIEFD